VSWPYRLHTAWGLARFACSPLPNGQDAADGGGGTRPRLDQAQAWPVVIGISMWGFRRQIVAKTADVKETTTPLVRPPALTARPVSWSRRQPTWPRGRRSPKSPKSLWKFRKPNSTSPRPRLPRVPRLPRHPRRRTPIGPASRGGAPRWIGFWRSRGSPRPLRQLRAPSDFGVARIVAPTSLPAVLAYSELERVACAAWTIDKMEAPRRAGGHHADERMPHSRRPYAGWCPCSRGARGLLRPTLAGPRK